MKFFNIDLHISVIEDIKQIFTSLGHEVTSWNLSNANWVFDRKPMKIEVIGQDNWGHLNQEMCDKFYNRYKNDFDRYDAFIVTFPPSFSWLFEKFNKPIIIQAPIRYEVPFSNKPELWNDFNDYLKKGIDSGKIIPCANSKLYAAYAEHFTDRKWKHIPNICSYIKASYNPRKSEHLWYSRLTTPSINNLVDKHKALGKHYPWTTLVKYKSLVGVPYNGSTMTMFECYNANLPMFFPTLEFMRELRANHPQQVLSEFTWAQTWNLESKSAILNNNANDPNNYNDIDITMKWVALSDFYDKEWMPYIQYFNSYEDLANVLNNTNLNDISSKMNSNNNHRRGSIIKLWENVIKDIK